MIEFLDNSYISKPTLELHSRAASSVIGMTTTQSFHREKSRRKAEKKCMLKLACHNKNTGGGGVKLSKLSSLTARPLVKLQKLKREVKSSFEAQCKLGPNTKSRRLNCKNQ